MKLSAEGGQAKPVAANATGETRSNLLSTQIGRFAGQKTLFLKEIPYFSRFLF
jgi:hypothetical protein